MSASKGTRQTRVIPSGAIVARLLVGMLLSASLFASPQRPSETLDRVSNQLLRQLEEEREVIRRRPQRFYEIIDNSLSPHVDFARISRWVVGKYWRGATPQQRERFRKAFHGLLVRFYGAALLDDPAYLDRLLAKGDDLITFQHASLPKGALDTTVRSEVHLPEGTTVPVHFRVHRRDGPWKVYDVTVEGISLVTNYRNSFSRTIAQQGLDVLIHRLEEQQRRLADETARRESSPR